MLQAVLLMLCCGLVLAVPASADEQISNRARDLRPVISEDSPEVVVPAGTPIRVRLLEHLNSQFTKDGERLRLEVVEDVIVNGRVVVRQGAAAWGLVGDARPAKGWGRKGKVEFSIDQVEGADGYPLQVDCDTTKVADNSTGAAVAAAYFAPLLGGGVKGKKARIHKGTEFIALVEEPAIMHKANLDRLSWITPGFRVAGPLADRPADPEVIVLRDGTSVSLQTEESISSQENIDGEFLVFSVTEDVIVDGLTVFPAGSRALGIVGDSRAAKGWGRKGKVEMEIVSVEAADGTPIPLRSGNMNRTGDQKVAETAIGVYSLGLAFGGAFKGGKVTIPKGTKLTVFVEGNHLLIGNDEPLEWAAVHGDLTPIISPAEPEF